MRTREQLKAAAFAAIDANRDKITAFGDSIYHEPELGYKEVKTAGKFKTLLEELGYDYKDKVARTGVIANLKGKKSKYRVAVMAELDAIVVPGHKDACQETGAAHACGHHCMMASLAGVAIALKGTGIMEELAGDIVLMAVPAEEGVEIEFRNGLRQKGEISFLGGKQEFIKLGVFDDVDFMIMQHIKKKTSDKEAEVSSNCNGFVSKLVQYIGKEAHAGGAPHEGINALNAAILGLSAIHAQRETFRSEDYIRVHPIITKGGTLVNVVPDDVRIETYVRGANAPAILDAAKKVDRALKSGGDAVGAETKIIDIPGYMPFNFSEELIDVVYENLCALYGTEKVDRMGPGFGGGSTDAGDVSQLIPTVHMYIAGASGNLHTEEFAVADKESAYLTAAKALTATAIDLLYDEGQTGEFVKKNFKAQLTKETYLKEWGKL
ncbi:MAG: amidohydrolase [Fusobacteriaceae bacterium]|jgi:amidohydrolase|nr:amidohydrolase [Fusobacteriaceae bacterium]